MWVSPQWSDLLRPLFLSVVEEEVAEDVWFEFTWFDTRRVVTDSEMRRLLDSWEGA